MRLRLIGLVIGVSASLLALLCGNSTARYQDTPAVVQVVENHQTAWRIVSPSRDDAGVTFAIEELQKYVERISGANLPVDDRPQGGPRIVVGRRGELAKADRTALPPPAQGYDGYAIAVRGGAQPTIRVAGDNARGTIYGVYDLLERWGCRWIYPVQDPADPEVVPRAASLRLSVAAWAVASPLQYRIHNGDAWYFDIQPDTAIKQVDHAAKIRCNMIGWQCAHDKPLAQQYDALRQQGVLGEREKRALTLHGPAATRGEVDEKEDRHLLRERQRRMEAYFDVVTVVDRVRLGDLAAVGVRVH